MKDKCPCENCITFPICKNKFIFDIHPSDKSYHIMNINRAFNICPPLKKWYEEPNIPRIAELKELYSADAVIYIPSSREEAQYGKKISM
jgi:hypothetical protein